MNTLPQEDRLPPTILDYLCTSLALPCVKCPEHVAVRWFPSREEAGEPAAWADHKDILLTHCHDCALKVAPEAYQATLKARFDHILDVRSRLHALMRLEQDRDGRVRPMPATVTSTRWYPVNRAGSKDPYLEEFTVIGWLPDEFDPEAAQHILAPSPTYRVIPSPPPAPTRHAAAVQMAIHARLPTVPDAYLELRWNPTDPGLSWEPIIRGFGRVSSKEVERLTYHGRRLFMLHPTTSGRIPAPVDAEKYIDLSEAFIKERKRAPSSWQQFAAFVGEKPSTLRDRFMTAGLWPWREFKADYFSEQVIRRVLASKTQDFP